MISYDGLYEQLRRKGITKTDLTSEIGISSRTIAKIAKGEKLSNNRDFLPHNSKDCQRRKALEQNAGEDRRFSRL